MATALPAFRLDWGLHAMMRLLESGAFTDVLDIGSGAGEHKRFLEHFGKRVFSVDLAHDADYVGDFTELDMGRTFEAVWCSHVLEHQRNVGAFLDHVFEVLAPGGWLALTVPNHPRNRLVAGHITSWSVPLLCYNLVLAGFDCRRAMILQTYELALVVQKREAEHRERGRAAAFDLDAVAPFLPFDADASPSFPEGQVLAINWGDWRNYRLPPSARPIRVSSAHAHPDLAPNLHFAVTA